MGIGIWELTLIFMIVIVLFGTKRLRTVGGDLGAAIKGFKVALQDAPIPEGTEPGPNGRTGNQLDS